MVDEWFRLEALTNVMGGAGVMGVGQLDSQMMADNQFKL